MLGMTSCSAVQSAPVVTAKIPNFEPATEIRKGQPNVYLIVKVMDSNYWQVIVNGARTAANEAGINLYLSGTDNETDWQSQMQIISKAIDAKADGLILSPDDSIKLTGVIGQLHDKQVPIALIDTVVNYDVFDI